MRQDGVDRRPTLHDNRISGCKAVAVADGQRTSHDRWSRLPRPLTVPLHVLIFSPLALRTIIKRKIGVGGPNGREVGGTEGGEGAEVEAVVRYLREDCEKRVSGSQHFVSVSTMEMEGGTMIGTVRDGCQNDG